MTTVIVDYDSGNLHSAHKAFQRMADEVASGQVALSSDPDVVRRADRIVLPGDGAFPACRTALFDHRGLFEALEEVAIRKAQPFLGICIGMQMMASQGLEYTPTDGFDWITGEVTKITPNDPAVKVPHMGWNKVNFTRDHPLLKGLDNDTYFYFVHSFYVEPIDQKLALGKTDYLGSFTSILQKEWIFATQFHPEKSAEAGLILLENFLKW